MMACAGLLVAGSSSRARTLSGGLPWEAGAATPPRPVRPGPWLFFTSDEAALVEAVIDRLIPADESSAGAKDAGCAVYIDRQLAGPYGGGAGLYAQGPFMPGFAGQGYQNPDTPAVRFRSGLKALQAAVGDGSAGKKFQDLSPAGQDTFLMSLENGSTKLDGANGAGFFALVLQMTQEGFFADPIYGGNRDMVGWKLIGFPGARYDYRDWVERHNEKYPLPPIGIMGGTRWTSKD